MIRIVLSNVLITAALVFMALGIIGIFRFHHFYARILITSKIEVVGFLTLMAGIVIRYGLSFFSLKVGLISLFVLLTNPISTMAITRSAHKSGVKPQSEAKLETRSETRKVDD